MTNSLAILGGVPIRNEPQPAYNTIGAAEREAVLEVLESGELSGFVAGPINEFWGGRKVQELEKAFCDHFGTKYAIAVNSATSALHCAVSAMGVGPGDEVIVSPYTMSASATCILMTGAVPIFADIDPDTFCLTPNAVEAAISPNTRGIVAVNIFGHPADLDALREIADRHGLFLIEDNAQAPDANYRGRKTATIGDAGVFSFNRHKIMQCGEGGVLVTNDKRIAFKAAAMRNHGEVAVEGMGYEDDLVNTIGVNYRMTEMEAAVALCQFEKMERLNAERIELAERISRGLKDIPGIQAPKVADGCSHVYYFYVMKYNASVTGIPRDLFARAVQAEGFYIRPGYVRPLYLEPLYQEKICFGSEGFPFSANSRNHEINYAEGLCPVTERLQNEEILLTNITYAPHTLKDMDDFIAAIRKVLDNREELLGSASRLGKAAC